jgi:acylphosphatase
VQGFVRNLPDGQVELQVEGDQAVVDDYLRRVAERMRENILAANVEAMPPRGFERFEVRM